MTAKLEKKAEGVYLAGRFSNWKVGAWILNSGPECLVMEMPPASGTDENPAAAVKQILDENRWRCRYLFFSHPHWDHTASVADYRRLFPDATFIAHYSAPLFLKMSDYYWTSGNLLPRWSPWAQVKEQWGEELYMHFDLVFTTDTYELSLGGEPLYLIYGPKHSLGDVHCIFRGIHFSGDWWIYEGDPCEDLAASSKAESSIRRLMDFTTAKKYVVHSIFPAHADNLMYRVDFQEVMQRTLDYHLKMNERIPEFEKWRDFGLDILYSYFFPRLPQQKKVP